jgi:hypothetical protein
VLEDRRIDPVSDQLRYGEDDGKKNQSEDEVEDYRAFPSWLTAYGIEVAQAMRVTLKEAIWNVPLSIGLSLQHHRWVNASMECQWLIEDLTIEDEFELLSNADFQLSE